jgi:hypothetical protein
MRYQDHVILLTTHACENLYRTARAVSSEHVQWSPMERCASVLELFQECAQFPRGIATIVRTRAVPPLPHEEIERLQKEKDGLRTIDQCEGICRIYTAELLAAVREFPADYLDDEMYLPLGIGREYTLAEIMLLHQQNVIYHTAQIDYVRTLYGDLSG